jgi:hypothetical protein
LETMLKRLEKLDKLDDFDKRIKMLEKKVEGRVVAVDQGAAYETRLAKLKEKEALDKQVVNGDSLASMHEELDQIEVRQNNVVIHGLKETLEDERDHKQVKEFLMATESGEELNFQVLYWAGQRGPKPPTLVVRFNDAEQKEKILNKVKNLRGKVEFKGVNLAPDLTKKQREINKQKEAELKEEANKCNQQMSEEQKNEGSSAVVGCTKPQIMIPLFAVM